MVCVGGICQIGGDECENDGDCGAGERCVVGQCIGACDGNEDCPFGEACDLGSGQCVEAACANLANLQVNVARAGQLDAAADGFFLICAPENDPPAADQTFRFVLGQQRTVDFDVDPIDGFVYVIDRCGNAPPPNVLACGPEAAFDPVQLDAGEYFVVVERNGGGEGNFSITLRFQ